MGPCVRRDDSWRGRWQEARLIPCGSIPRDYLALAVIHTSLAKHRSGTPPHQKLRPTSAHRVVTATTLRRLTHLLFRQLRKREDRAPHLPGGVDLDAVRAYTKRDRQSGVAMREHQHLGIVETTHGDAEEIADADVDRHPHATQVAVKNNAFAMQFDVPDAAIRTLIVRIEADR